MSGVTSAPDVMFGNARQLRVLVIDDSVLDRRILSEILKGDANVETVGIAPTISVGLQKIVQLTPDVVLLDAGMVDPDASVLDTVRRIHSSWPDLPIVMVCEPSNSDPGQRALELGATVCVTKPGAHASSDDRARFPSELIAKVRAVTAPTRAAPVSRTKIQCVSRRPAAFGPVSAIAIGASTGGPNALAQVFASLPRDLAVPVLIVQHMPPMFTRMLAERLVSTTGFDVVEATDGELVLPGRAYIAPGDFHMIALRDTAAAVRIGLHQEAPEGSCRPAVDVLFRSVARAYGPGSLAVVLTGMGHDGTRGAKQIFEAGGSVIVQEASTCVVATMPTSVAGAVSVDGIYPLDAIGPELAARVRRRFGVDAAPFSLSRPT